MFFLLPTTSPHCRDDQRKPCKHFPRRIPPFPSPFNPHDHRFLLHAITTDIALVCLTVLLPGSCGISGDASRSLFQVSGNFDAFSLLDSFDPCTGDIAHNLISKSSAVRVADDANTAAANGP